MSIETRPDMLSGSDPPPTVARLGALFFVCTLALLLYIDRICIGQAATFIKADLGLSDDQMSWVFIAFTLSYTLFEVPTGHWGDRFGTRGVIARIVIWWSIFTALTGAAWSLVSLMTIRFLFGAGEAGAFPNAALIVTKWFPQGERGRVRGLITTLSFVGAALAPVLFNFCNQYLGWRWTFSVFGALGIVWSAAFLWWFRDNPAVHPWVNEAERKLIQEDAGATVTPHPHAPIPWGIVLARPTMWILGSLIMIGASVFYTQFQWYSTYLLNVHHLQPEDSGWYTSVIMIGGALGCLTGGIAADFSVRITGERRWSRRLCGAGALVLAGLSMAAVPYMKTPLQCTLCNASAQFFVQVSIPTWWTVVAEISGRHGASMWGLMNSMGGLGVMGTTKLIGSHLAKLKNSPTPVPEQWNDVFEGLSTVLFLGAVLWLMVNTTRSLVERAPSESELA